MFVTKKTFAFRCFVVSVLNRPASSLIISNRIEHATRSPADFSANMVKGIPTRLTIIVTPCPSWVLGVIFPYPKKEEVTVIACFSHVLLIKRIQIKKLINEQNQKQNKTRARAYSSLATYSQASALDCEKKKKNKKPKKPKTEGTVKQASSLII